MRKRAGGKMLPALFFQRESSRVRRKASKNSTVISKHREKVSTSFKENCFFDGEGSQLVLSLKKELSSNHKNLGVFRH